MNLSIMRRTFGEDAYKAMCATLSISVCDTSPVAADDEITSQNLVSDGTNSIQVWQANSRNTTHQPYMSVNGTEIGRSAVPSELVRVTYMGRSLFVQILYDEGSQITLVNRFCEPLIMNTRQTEKAIRISGVVGNLSKSKKY